MKARLLAGSLLLLLGACAEERAPVSRVQANALPKAFFVGDDLESTDDDPEFYMRATVVDVSFGTQAQGLFASSYAQPVSRIRWEITEGLLLGRLTYELIENTDHRGAVRSDEGLVVAAFPIESHFDIRREYNPTTGEELNLIVENASERRWFERGYIRVDWSSNLVTDAYTFDTLSMLGIANAVEFQPLKYYVSDPDDDDAPVLDIGSGYLDITNLVYAAPRIVDTPYGSYPACYFIGEYFGGTYPLGSCDPSEVKVRLSFRQVEDTDYEAKDWDGNRFSMFGAFYNERRGYDDAYGVVDSTWHRFGNFYNLWKTSHLGLECNTPITTPVGADPRRDGGPGREPDGTDDECQAQGAPAGSRCDVFAKKCTIPYAQRETRRIPWHYGPNSVQDLFPESSDATKQWDLALRMAVQAGRLTECRQTNGGSIGATSREACEERFANTPVRAKLDVPEILFLCHNPVAASDPSDCGSEGEKARLGDLRYNFVNAFEQPAMNSPWGIMVDGADPLTGEKVQTSVNVWDAVSVSAAQGAVDVIRWVNGEISDEDIKSGAHVNQQAVTGDRVRKSMGEFSPLGSGEEPARLAALTRQALAPAPATLPAESAQAFETRAVHAMDQVFGDPIDPTGAIAARTANARASGLDLELATGPMRALAGLDPSQSIEPESLALASPLGGNNLPAALATRKAREDALARNGACMLEAPDPHTYIALAKVMADKFPLPENATPAQIESRTLRMREYLRKRLYYGVMLHEMGHSIGLRHNFTGSFDSFNYWPQYWQLRTNNGAVEAECAPGDSGADCVGPRWRDPVTTAEQEGLIGMWQHTTVMDYPGDATQDVLGLGPYDFAATRFFYTDTVDMWNAPGETCVAGGECTTPSAYAVRSRVNNVGGIGGPWTFKGPLLTDAMHYSAMQKEISLIRDCEPAAAVVPEGWDEATQGVFHPVFDGATVLGTRCQRPPMDVTGYRDLEERTLERKTGRIRWPHMFATDYSADIGNVAVMRHDNGSDIFEQFSFLISLYENRHIFDNFRRGRQAFTVRGAAVRSMGRYSDKMRNLIQGFALYHDYFLRAFSVETGADFFEAYENNDGLLKPNVIAASMAFDHFTRQLLRPQPGVHGTLRNFAGDRVLFPAEETFSGVDALVNIPEGSRYLGNGLYTYGARKLNNALSNADGSFDIQWLTSAGSYYDKIFSAYHLTESSNRFLDVSPLDFLDRRYRNLSFVNLYPDGFRRLIGAALTGDTMRLGARVSSTNGKTPEVDEAGNLKRPIGWVSWWPKEGPRVCWPGAGATLCEDPYSGEVLSDEAPVTSLAVDPQIGIEVQKFLVFFSLLYLPENWKTDWVEQFRIYKRGPDADPALPEDHRVDFRDPESGVLYSASSTGREVLLGQEAERAIGARMIAWANTLVMGAYEIESVHPVTGEVTVQRDGTGAPILKKVVGATACEDSRPCSAVRNYRSLLEFTRKTAADFKLAGAEVIGTDL